MTLNAIRLLLPAFPYVRICWSSFQCQGIREKIKLNLDLFWCQGHSWWISCWGCSRGQSHILSHKQIIDCSVGLIYLDCGIGRPPNQVESVGCDHFNIPLRIVTHSEHRYGGCSFQLSLSLSGVPTPSLIHRRFSTLHSVYLRSTVLISKPVLIYYIAKRAFNWT